MALAQGAPGGRAEQLTSWPNLVMGTNVQVCWEKFCRYWEVEPVVPLDPGRFHCPP